MADHQNILGGRLSLEDNYSSVLSRFANSVLGAENRFKQFANNILGSNQKIGNSLSLAQKDVDKFAQKFIQQGNSVANAINKANKIVEQNQERTIDGLTKKYLKLGMTIQDAYGKAQKESNGIWNGNSNSPKGGNDEIKEFAQSILSGGIGGVLGKLGLIGTGITATVGILKKIDGAMDMGFGMLNKMSDGMLSYEGIKSALYESMDFELGRQQLNLFYGSDEKGGNTYKSATKVAVESVGGVQDSINIMARLGMSGATETTDEQLRSLLDAAATKPQLSIDHIGFALQEAIYGRISSLSMNYGINNDKLIKYLDGLKKSDNAQYNKLKGALNKEGTANDPQKYVNLVTSYIENSPMDGYAETYAKTTKGKLERLEDVWQQMKAEIMGIDVAKGEKKPGGAFEAFDNMVDNLSDKLGEDKTKSAFETIAKGFGDGFASLGNAFGILLEKTDWEKVAEGISKSIGVISDSLINLSNSGALEELAENLPKIIETLVDNKLIDVASNVEIGTKIANHDIVGAGESWYSKWYDKALNFIGVKDKDGKPIRIEEKSKEFDSKHPWLSRGLDIAAREMRLEIPYKLILGKLFKSGIESVDTSSNMATDSQIAKKIATSDISVDKKKELKEIINSDGIGSYNINISNLQINSDNVDEFIAELKQCAANNKK